MGFRIKSVLKIIVLTGILAHPSSCRVLNRPKIKIAFICNTDEYVRLKCNYRDKLLQNLPDIVDMIEHQHKFYFNDQLATPVFMGLMCIAPYPVKWTHFQQQWLKDIAEENWLHVLRLQYTSFQRIVKDIEKPATYRYASFRVITNHVGSDSNFALGEYTCDELKKPGLHVKSTEIVAPPKFKVYRRMSVYDSVFPLSRKNVTIYIEDNREEDESIVIPCHVSNPNTTVTLYRKFFENVQSKRSIFPFYSPGKQTEAKIDEKWEVIPEAINLHFKPQLGFVYSEDKAPTSYHLSPGTYKCTANYLYDSTTPPPTVNSEGDQSENEDWVIVQVVAGHRKVEPHVSFINPPALFNVTLLANNQFMVTCCSRSSVPPALFLSPCMSQDICQRQIDYSDISSETTSELSSVKGNCVETVPMTFISTFIIPEVYRCVGAGIDYRTTVIFPLARTAKEKKTPNILPMPYLDWKDVDPYRMIAIKLRREKKWLTANKSFVLYDNQNATFKCTASLAYFAFGTKATINYDNDTRFLIPEMKMPEEIFLMLFNHGVKLEFNVTITSNVKSISCLAPVVDSAQWIEKTIKIVHKQGEIPSIIGSNQEVVNWVINDTDKTLTCKFGGVPVPTIISWTRNGQKLITKTTKSAPTKYKGFLDSSNNLIRIVSTHNVSILHVKVVDYEMHGTYVCIVKNVLGEARKSFQVFVMFSDQTWITASVMIGVFGLIGVCFLMGITTWRRRQKLLLKAKQFGIFLSV